MTSISGILTVRRSTSVFNCVKKFHDPVHSIATYFPSVADFCGVIDLIKANIKV